MTPFPLFEPPAIAVQIEAITFSNNLRSSAYFRLLRSDDVTFIYSTGSQECINVTDSAVAFGS